MGWIGRRGGGGGGPRCIVLAASGQTFHRPSQLSSLFCLSSFFFCPRSPTSLSLPTHSPWLPFRSSLRPFLFSLLSPETPDNYCRLSRFRWPPRFSPTLLHASRPFCDVRHRRGSEEPVKTSRDRQKIVRSRSLTIFQ